MFTKRNIVALLVMAISSMAVLCFHSYIGSMSRFVADDYCEAYIAQHFGFFRSIWYWYISWDGTFSGSIVDWLLIFIKAEGITFVIPVLLMIWVAATASTIYLFLSQEYSSFIKVLASITFGAMMVFVTLLISPNVPQSLYWWTGMRSYTVPVILFTFYWFLFQWFVFKWKKGSLYLWSILSFCFIFLIGGLSETFTPVLTIFFIGWIAFVLLTKKPTLHDRSFFFILGGMFGAITSLIVVVGAPGNTVRQGLFTPPLGIFEVFKISISAFLVYISNIFITPEKIAGVLGAFLATVWLGSMVDHPNKSRAWILPVILLAGVALTFGCFLPAAWGLSDAPPDRSLSIPSFLLVATILILGFSTGSLLSDYITSHKLDVIRTGFLIITLACIVFSAWVNMNNLYNGRQVYIEFSRKWDMVNEQVIQAKLAGKPVVHIPAMDSWTTLDKPTNNPHFWQNICYSDYYDIKIISP